MSEIKPKNLVEILQHHLSGGKFQYLSYDHKKAEAEHKQSKAWADYLELFKEYPGSKPTKANKHDIPKELRAKYAVWKVGKLRRVEFSNDGSINRLYIGSKYAIPVYGRECLDIVRLVI